MIRKLKRRYLITNMALLSGTLLVCLAVLFGILYHSEVAVSYTVMQDMMEEMRFPEKVSMDMPHPNAYIEDGAAIAPLAYRDGERNHGNHDFGGNPPEPPPYWDIPEQPGWNGGEGGRDPSDRYDDGREPQQQATNPQQQDTEPPASQTQTAATAPATRKNPPESVHPSQTRPTQTRPAEDERADTPSGGQIQPSAGSKTQPVVSEPAQSSASETVTSSGTVSTSAKKTTAAETAGTAAVTPPMIPVEDGHYIPDAFVADISPDGNIEAYAGNDRNDPDDEQFRTVHRAADEVKKRGAAAGTVDVGDRSYRFLYQPDEAGTYRLVLLDRKLELSTLSRLIFIFLLIAVFGLLLMFGISMLLANWTVTPIALAWEKQKQFVADASHELKTPLAVISANTEVILANPQESVSGQSKWLAYIQSETMRMSKLITNLLSIARMDSDASDKENTLPLSLSEVVSNICLVFEPIIYENGKTLNTVIQRGVMFSADEDSVKQLLSILLDNAVLHSVPRAQITVSLSKDAQGKIRLAVANTAKDIPQEQLAHLFDRFYRVDTEGDPNGSGLGLSIAKSIVRQLNGKLTVTSENQLVTFVAVFSS